MLLCSSAMLTASFRNWRKLKISNMGLKEEMRGEITRNGKLKRWRCTICDFDASDGVAEGIVGIEMNLVQELSDMSGIAKNKLSEWLHTVDMRLGLKHWLAAG